MTTNEMEDPKTMKKFYGDGQLKRTQGPGEFGKLERRDFGIRNRKQQNKNGSLAATAAQSHLTRHQNLPHLVPINTAFNLAPLDTRDPHYHNTQRSSSDQKRQKTYDFSEEDCWALCKEFECENYLILKERFKTFKAVLKHLESDWSRPGGSVNFTPGWTQRGIERAFGYTPLSYGFQVRGFGFHSAFGFVVDTDEAQDNKGRKWLLNPDWEDIIRDFSPLRFPERPGFRIFSANHLPQWANPENNNNMATSGDSTLFEESFTITTLDDKKYDRVLRIGGTSADSQTIMTVDINSELFPCQMGETLHCALASSLALDGSKDDKGWRDVSQGESTLADMFDYVCHGKIYKFEDVEDGQTIKCFISFGGLLMFIEGPYKKITPLRVDYVYLLLKK